MIGQKLSVILEEIEDTLWEFEANDGKPPGYTSNGFRAAIKIFMSALMDKMWELQQDEDLTLQDRINMASKAGEDIRALVKTYTDVDCHTFYKNDLQHNNQRKNL